MHTISTELRFEAAHQLHQLPAWHKCSRVHGHNYVVTVELASDDLDDHGFVVDFGDVKRDLGAWIDGHWDHRFLTPSRYRNTDERVDSESGVPDNMVPEVSTAEHLAQFLAEVCQAHATSWPWALLVQSVTVWETPTSYATHHPAWLDIDVTQPEIPDETIEQVAEKVAANIADARARKGGPVLGLAEVEVGVMRTDEAGDQFESHTVAFRGPHFDRVEVDEPAFQIQGPPEPKGEHADDARIFRRSPVSMFGPDDKVVSWVDQILPEDSWGEEPPQESLTELLTQIERNVATARDLLSEPHDAGA